jgi:hypothetical protein
VKLLGRMPYASTSAGPPRPKVVLAFGPPTAQNTGYSANLSSVLSLLQPPDRAARMMILTADTVAATVQVRCCREEPRDDKAAMCTRRQPAVVAAGPRSRLCCVVPRADRVAGRGAPARKFSLGVVSRAARGRGPIPRARRTHARRGVHPRAGRAVLARAPGRGKAHSLTHAPACSTSPPVVLSSSAVLGGLLRCALLRVPPAFSRRA